MIHNKLLFFVILYYNLCSVSIEDNNNKPFTIIINNYNNNHHSAHLDSKNIHQAVTENNQKASNILPNFSHLFSKKSMIISAILLIIYYSSFFNISFMYNTLYYLKNGLYKIYDFCKKKQNSHKSDDNNQL
jgi:hypothetical protein